ncbi:hypothetical protein ALC60_04706, partial [Trachymyrmex zeteki]
TIVSVARSSVKWPVVGRGKRKEFRGPGLTQLIWRMGLSLHSEHGHCLRIYDLVLRSIPVPSQRRYKFWPSRPPPTPANTPLSTSQNSGQK